MCRNTWWVRFPKRTHFGRSFSDVLVVLGRFSSSRILQDGSKFLTGYKQKPAERALFLIINIDMTQAVANLARNRANQEQNSERDAAEHFYSPSQGHCAEAQDIGVDRFPGIGKGHVRDGRPGGAAEDSRSGQAGQLRSAPGRAVARTSGESG